MLTADVRSAHFVFVQENLCKKQNTIMVAARGRAGLPSNSAIAPAGTFGMVPAGASVGLVDHFPPSRGGSRSTPRSSLLSPRSSAVATPRDGNQRFRLPSPRKERLGPLSSAASDVQPYASGTSVDDEAVAISVAMHVIGQNSNPAEFGGKVREMSARGHARLRVPDLPQEYLEHRLRMRLLSEAAAEEERARRAALEALEAAKQGGTRARARNPRSRSQVVGSAALLSSASDCAALLGGTLRPQDFAETVASMPSREDMRQWLNSFGACVARLGGTLQDLHNQLNKQLKSDRQAKLAARARVVLQQVEAFEEAFDAVAATTKAQSRSAAEHGVRLLATAAHAHCEKPQRKARLWTRTLLAAVKEVERDARLLREAQLAISEASEGALGRCAAAICFHACRLLGAEEACVYIGVHGTTREGLATGRETLYRLISSRPTQEEVNACNLLLGGTRACEVSPESLAGACLAQPKKALRADRGVMDPRYEAGVDRLPGQPPPQGLLYIDLSDPGGPLRACLRLAHPSGAPETAFSPRAEREALELAPLFQLALRHPCRVAAADRLTANRAAAMRSIGACLESASERGRQADVGGIVASFEAQARGMAHCEGCAIFILDQGVSGPGKRLVRFPADIARDEPTTVVIDDPAAAANGKSALPYGFLGFSAVKRQLLSISDLAADGRGNPSFDCVPGQSSDTKSLLCVPFDNVSTGEPCGVALLVNKLDDEDGLGFGEEDEGLMFSLLKVVGMAVESWNLRSEIERERGRRQRRAV